MNYVLSSFPTDRSKAVQLLQYFFVHLWFHMWRLFYHVLLLISPYVGTSEELCVVIMAFPGYINLYLHKFCSLQKKIREKSRECHNHKPQPFPDPKRKREPTNPNKHKSNKRTKSTKISSLFPKRGNRNSKRTEKHKKKIHMERHTTNRLVE